jgi:outer membrane protein assembly factor BamA
MKVVIGSISFKGNKKFTDAELLKAVELKIGDPMSPELIKKALNRLIAYYRSHGANLSVSPNIDPTGGHATVQFIIDENGTKGDAGLFQPNGGGQPGGAPPAGNPPPASK